MKILNATQIRELDSFTIEHTPIASIDLMERAAKACAEKIIALSDFDSRFIVVCGNGNNGGDGFAIARILHQAGLQVVCICFDGNLSDDNSKNKQRYNELNGSQVISYHTKETHDLSAFTHIIDALLGSGLNRSAEGEMASCISWINEQKLVRIAIDVPSGFSGDTPLDSGSQIVRAHHTLCFHSPRLAFFFPESFLYVGKWHVLDIDLLEPESISTPHYAVHYGDVCQFLPPIHPFAHKGTQGHALLIGGSYGKTGAILLSAKASLRSGAGLVSVFAPKSSYHILQTALPEAMFIPSEADLFVSGLPKDLPYQAIGFGPGAGLAEPSASALKLLIQQWKGPLVIDADGLNILAENKTWLSFLPPFTILTPHPKEMERLCGQWNNGFEQLELAKAFCNKYRCILVMKGAYTAITLPDGSVYFNTNGNPGMATGGSGDVLTGIISGLLARGLKPYAAAILGVYIHGLAGDFAAVAKSMDALKSGDIIEFLPQAWKHLRD